MGSRSIRLCRGPGTITPLRSGMTSQQSTQALTSDSGLSLGSSHPFTSGAQRGEALDDWQRGLPHDIAWDYDSPPAGDINARIRATYYHARYLINCPLLCCVVQTDHLRLGHTNWSQHCVAAAIEHIRALDGIRGTFIALNPRGWWESVRLA
ncbi:hypothetical protein N7512_007496 [Penicillium capsulatum]|nr:hypothetical protein N7512_007496 [Penicillium capsulatum]